MKNIIQKKILEFDELNNLSSHQTDVLPNKYAVSNFIELMYDLTTSCI